MSKTPTPITDACEQAHDEPELNAGMVWAEDMRKLERENARLREGMLQAYRAVRRAQDAIARDKEVMVVAGHTEGALQALIPFLLPNVKMREPGL
jgi:hypothetical protein